MWKKQFSKNFSCDSAESIFSDAVTTKIFVVLWELYFFVYWIDMELQEVNVKALHSFNITNFNAMQRILL